VNLKWRITLVTALLIAIASSTIGVASYVSISRAQISAVDSSLQNAIGANPARAAERRPPRDRESSDFYTPIAIGQVSRDGEVSVIRPAGTTASPEAFPQLPLSDIEIGPDRALTFTDPISGNEFRLVARPAGRDMRVVVVVGLEDYSNTMSQILVSIIAYVVGVTLLGAVISWFVVRRFFTPVDSMIAAAGEISRGNTSLLVPNATPGTELGDLADSLNMMLQGLRDSLLRTQESEQALRSFVSDASHEIRTPLTVIRGYGELLLAQSSATESERRAFERIDSEAKRLERLVTSLLELDRGGGLQSVQESVPLSAIVSTCFDDLIAISPRPVTTSIESVTVTGDPNSWEQVLANITQNIIRYTPAGSPVNVQLHRIMSEGNSIVELVVDDSGPGIPEGMRERIFDRFARLDDSRSTDTGGFGLGMSIIKATVIAHSGVISLEESPAGGLRIRIRVPITE
jgi:two-component system OmpR family sensor kinase